MNKEILVSIIMPTLNSERTIEMALKSIKEQDFDHSKLEILVVDGGSTDRTRKISKKFGATIVENIEVSPEYGIFHGYEVAKGKYWAIMGSDEVLLSKTSLKDRCAILDSGKTDNVVTAGLLTPSDYPRVSRYINALGDPFSYFIYRLDSENYQKSLKNRYTHDCINSGTLFRFGKNDILPIVDGAHMFNSNSLKASFKNISPEIVPLVFYKMAQKSNTLGVAKDDYILHYSGASTKQLYRKSLWRVKNNIMHPASPNTGFANRSAKNLHLQYKKFLFIPYGLSVILPLFDAIKLSLSKKDAVFLHHFLLTEYVLILLAFYSVLKLSGKKSVQGVYGE